MNRLVGAERQCRRGETVPFGIGRVHLDFARPTGAVDDAYESLAEPIGRTRKIRNHVPRLSAIAVLGITGLARHDQGGHQRKSTQPLR